MTALHDVHGEALLRSRKRAALRAWQECCEVWQKEGQPRGLNAWQSKAAKETLRHFARSLNRVGMGLDLTVGPAGVAEGW